MNECHIHIETSLRWPRKGSGIVGIIFTDSEDTFSKTLFGQVRDSTEHKAVLIGIQKALGYCHSYEVIHLHLSCGYAAGAFKWLSSWKANNWKNAKGEPIKHLEEWQAIEKEIEKKQLKIHLNEFNGYRRWLRMECDNRGRKHGFIL